MMVGWQACFIVLIAGLVSGKDYPLTSKYVVREIESCPDVGYFFKRDPSPNAVDPGPCHLCFCKDNGTAVCWERDRRRCDAENYHHHRIGRQSRIRRSISLSDIFFRDASRDFFKKRLPEECEPFESSFSDGCPPADWCIGCTVCDCDANGRWDCHILSFCDGKESKKKVKPNRALQSKRPDKRKTEAKNVTKKLKTTTSTTMRPTKRVIKKYVQSKRKPMNQSQNKSRNITNKTPKKQAVRQLPQTFQIPRTQPKKVIIKKTQSKKPKSQKTQQQKQQKQKLQSQKPRPQKPQSQKPQQQQQQKQKPQQRKPQSPKLQAPKLNPSKIRIIKNGGVNKKTAGLQRENLRKIINANSNDTHKLGQKVVKQVMSTVQKLLIKEMEKMNATRIQRSIDLAKEGCGGTKENDTHGKSKKGRKKKRKHRKKSYTIKDNFYSDRFKRELVNEPQMKVGNETLGILLPGNNSVLPLADPVTVKSENDLSTDSTVGVTLNSTIQEVDYYKYSLINNRNGTTNISATQNATEHNKPGASLNLLIPLDPGYNKVDNKTIVTLNPIFNDLKFTKWFIIKVKNNKQKKSVEGVILPKSTIFDDIKAAEDVYLENKLQNKDSGNKYGTKKYKSNNKVGKNCSRLLMTSRTSLIRNETTVTGLQNLIKELNKSITTRHKPKPKFDIMKSLKRFFHKMISNKKSKSHKVYGIGTKEDHTLQILCENIGPCKVNRSNKYLLKYKLKQLNKETETILKSIRTIKGLLHLLELPDNDEINGLNKSNSSQNNMRKLSTILRDNYDTAEMTTPLTDTQITQIKYIKSNTNVFIESVRKFAEILNETIALIKPNNMDNKHFVEFLSKSKKNNIPFNRIRKILSQYNVIQNTFMRRMYEIIHGEGNKTSTTERILEQLNLKENNTDKVIENYSRNIIENLKKLKNLAKALSSKRKKRYVERMDGTVEYLLAVMEYLIKQNYPFNAIPANDGIDYLLDAIKNAPDVKPIENNFMELIPTPKSVVKPRFESEQIIADSDSYSNRRSKEEKELNKDSGSSDGNIWIVEKNTEVVLDVTPKGYYRKFHHKTNEEDTENDSEKSLEHNNTTEKHSQEESEKVGFEKFESSIDGTKKLEIYAGDMEDEGNGDGTDDVLPTNNSTGSAQGAEEANTSPTNMPEASVITTTQSKEYGSESQDSRSVSNKTKLDWLEETFDREIREFAELNVSSPSSTSASDLSPTVIHMSKEDNAHNNTDNGSGITAELEDSIERKKKSTRAPTPDNVMYEKEIEFLNSLDYGTDKPDLDERNAKHDKSGDGKSDYDFSPYYS